MPPEGKLTSIDNTRLTAARELNGLNQQGKPIKPSVRVRSPSEPLRSPQEKKRVINRKKNSIPQTWGGAARERIRLQKDPIKPGDEYGITSVPRVTNRPKK